jgi:hypothetical protein
VIGGAALVPKRGPRQAPFIAHRSSSYEGHEGRLGWGFEDYSNVGLTQNWTYIFGPIDILSIAGFRIYLIAGRE